MRIATVVALLLAPTGLLLAQAPAVSGKVVSCIDPNTRALISCDSPTPSAAAPGLNPTVAAAANSLGQALGQALIRSLFSRPSSTTASAPRPDSAAIARALERARVARTKEELMNALGISPGDVSGLTMTGDAPAELHMAADPAPGQLQLVGAPPGAPNPGPGPSVEDTTPTVGTLDLHVGDASLLSPAMSMGYCRFRPSKPGVISVNDIGQIRALSVGRSLIYEQCANATAAILVVVRAPA